MAFYRTLDSFYDVWLIISKKNMTNASFHVLLHLGGFNYATNHRSWNRINGEPDME